MTDTPEFPPEVVEAVRRYMGARVADVESKSSPEDDDLI
jgi:hypothetical protein